MTEIFNNPFNQTSTLVPEFTGSAWDTIKAVADNLDNIEGYFATAQTYLGGHDTPPTLRSNNTPLQNGDSYFNTVDSKQYIYTNNEWTIVAVLEREIKALTSQVTNSTTILANVDALTYTLKANSSYDIPFNLNFSRTGDTDLGVSVGISTSQNTLMSGSAIVAATNTTVTENTKTWIIGNQGVGSLQYSENDQLNLINIRGHINAFVGEIDSIFNIQFALNNVESAGNIIAMPGSCIIFEGKNVAFSF